MCLSVNYIDHSTIVRRLKKLGKLQRFTGYIFHKLSNKNEGRRDRNVTYLLQRNERRPKKSCHLGKILASIQKPQKKEGLLFH
ncbi:hypothetical protein TNCV_3165991 [Trichonephila clavipes]|uniref:Uncharacterized protein n=1 Tax=Trichonephila clavipes TaxID=2585209 RepID=A0A8X6V0Z0_TRICX|nr:hypothetical protein TNCV_3165991 [Trichonephila clavipes]